MADDETVKTLHQPSYRRFVLLALLSLVLPAIGKLSAETRVYHSAKPVHEFIPTFVDQLSGIQFKVMRHFNEATDGKLGFILALMPGQRYCEISFRENSSKGTVMQISTQDRTDEAYFSRIAARLGMSEPGVTPVKNESSSWPVPGR